MDINNNRSYINEIMSIGIILSTIVAIIISGNGLYILGLFFLLPLFD